MLRLGPHLSEAKKDPAIGPLPETTNSEFTPENGWLEDDCFPLGKALFLGANC